MNISLVDSLPNVHTLLHRFDVQHRCYVCFMREFLGGRRIAFADEVVHDDCIEVAVNSTGVSMGVKLWLHQSSEASSMSCISI
jgi:hypothetical protein